MREDAHRGLIAALARLGRDAEALRSYEHCRRELREELGIDPSPETQALYERVLVGHPPAPEPSSSPAHVELVFLGRDAELRRLRALLDDPTPGLTAVIGEPGIGKSRLLTEALGARTKLAVRATKCFKLIAPVPFAVLDDLVPGLMTANSDQGSDGSLGPEAAIARLAVRLVEHLPGDAIFVVDDLQWADEPSVQVIGLALRRRARLRVVASAREGEVEPSSAAGQLLDLAASLGLLERIELGPLRPDEVQAGGLSFADWQHTGGHPLFLAEHARGGSGADLAALVLGRAAGLGVEATDVLRAAAVVDRDAELEELAELARVPLDRVRRVAADLVREGMLTEQGGRWRPRHDVIAELVRDDLDEAVRRGLHRRVLARLTALGAPAPELAHHALGAADWAAAVGHSVAAGEHALAAFANRDAAAHFARARSLAAEHDAGRRRPATAGRARPSPGPAGARPTGSRRAISSMGSPPAEAKTRSSGS